MTGAHRSHACGRGGCNLNMTQVEVANRQTRLAVDSARLVQAAEQIVAHRGWQQADISLVLVEDAEMRRLNRQHLDHDYTTDVLSFVLDDSGGTLVGEVIVCTDVALREAERRGNDPGDELLLYVIHGLLHLVGYGDKSPGDAAAMRVSEQYWLATLGVPPDRLARLEVETDEAAILGEELR